MPVTQSRRPNQSLFDAYVFVDWSGAARKGPLKPKKDQIWIGERIADETPREERYCRTRREALAYLGTRLRAHVDASRRVLLGFDFAYGYPSGFAGALGLDERLPAWRAVWENCYRQIADDDANYNNRFEVAGQLNAIVSRHGQPGPFWGRPKKRTVPGLPRTSPSYPRPTIRGLPLAKFRHTEQRVGRRIFSPWQVFYTGSVGGQILTGLPCVLSLRNQPKLAAFSTVWPFETGFTPTPSPQKGPWIVHAEIWPSLCTERVSVLIAADRTLIRDRVQVRVLCEWAKDLDQRGELGAFFDTPSDLHDEAIQVCVAEEGWILGVR